MVKDIWICDKEPTAFVNERDILPSLEISFSKWEGLSIARVGGLDTVSYDITSTNGRRARVVFRRVPLYDKPTHL